MYIAKYIILWYNYKMNTQVFEPIIWESLKEDQIPNLLLLYEPRIKKLGDSPLQENMRQWLVVIQERMDRWDMNRALSAIHNLPLFFPVEWDMPNNGYSECKRLYTDLLGDYDRLQEKLFPSQFKSRLPWPVREKVVALVWSIEN